VIRLLTLLLLCIAVPAYADSDSFVVAITRGQVPVSVVLDVPADFVVVPISISSSEKDPQRSIENVQAFTERLKDAVRKSPTIKLRQGSVSLSIAQGDDGGFSSFMRL
jgi:hypothetical protein